ncbi:MAG: hypothetical protein ACI4DY_06480 [Monoglobaceae bacterium]
MQYEKFTPNGKNRTVDIVDAIMHAPKDTTLLFEKGTYDFYLDGAYRRYLFPGCNLSSEKNIIFPLLGKKNITIDGNGSLFLFHDRVFPLAAENCENLTLRNFIVDFSFPRCAVAHACEYSENGLVLKIDRNKYALSISKDNNLIISTGSYSFNNCERRFFLQQKHGTVCYIASGKTYYENKNLPAPVFFCDAEEREDGILLRFKGDYVPKFEPDKPIIMSFDENRENDVFFFERCKNIKAENITIHSGAGMGFTGQTCENIEIIGCKITPKNQDELYSTTADAMLLNNFSGKIRVENCLIDRTLDDAMAFMGYYTMVDKITAPNILISKFTHDSEWGANIYLPGDTITVSDGKTKKEIGTAKIRRATVMNKTDRIVIEFEEPVEDWIKPGDYLDNKERMPEIYIANNTLINTCSIRVGSSKKTVIENNIMKNSYGILINDLISYWAELGATKDVTIRNNIFDSNSINIDAFVERPFDSGVKHELIRIYDNKFSNCDRAIRASSVARLELSGNSFENVKEPLTVENCDEVIDNCNK